MIYLKKYQEQAVDDLVKATKRLLPNNQFEEKTIVFQAPTGAGKTITMANYMLKMQSEIEVEDEFTFLWVSVGQGGLHLQSKRSLENYLDGKPAVYLYEDEYMSGRDRLEPLSVAVVNWEKIRSQDKEGNWKNKAMKEADDFYNLLEICEKTRRSTKIILIIDESHLGKDAERTKQLRSEIKAAVTIEVSATPKLSLTIDDIEDGKAARVRIKAEDVIREQMIKKEVLINPDTDNFNDKTDEATSEKIILEAAFAQRESLEKAYAIEGTAIKPLVLIQLPDSDAGDAARTVVESFLKSKGKTYEDKTVAIGLSQDKSPELEKIAAANSKIEFLLFKTAFGTGWDCPRAQILVMLRRIKSVSFSIQTVGRILRTPEAKHYSNEALNAGYVYTNIFPVTVQTEAHDPKIIKHLKSTRRQGVLSFTMPSYYQKRADFGTLTTDFYPYFDNTFCDYFNIDPKAAVQNPAENTTKAIDKGFDLRLERNTALIGEKGKIAAKDYDNSQAIQTSFDSLTKSNARKEDSTLEQQYLALLWELCSSYAVRDSAETIVKAVNNFFRNYFGIDPRGQNAIYIQNIILRSKNEETFRILVKKAIDVYEPKRKEGILAKNRDDNYELTTVDEDVFSSETHEEINNMKLGYFDKYYRSKTASQVEKDFENWLENQADKVAYWYKNGVSKRSYFGIQYFKGTGCNTFYPDYLVKMKDGKVWIFDTKGGKTAEDATERAECLQNWLEKQRKQGVNTEGGIIVADGATIWRINQEKEYKYEVKNLSEHGWKFLNHIFE